MSSKHKYKGEWDGPVYQWTNTETGDLCPVEWRWSSVTAAALTALRPSKRGPTPDNQKRKDG